MGYKTKIVDIREEILRKRRAGKLPGNSTSTLKTWWQSHSKWPYPTVLMLTHHSFSCILWPLCRVALSICLADLCVVWLGLRHHKQVKLNPQSITLFCWAMQEDDKARLVQETGLQLKQINNWFINQRKRNWHSNPSSSSSSSSLKTKRKRFANVRLTMKPCSFPCKYNLSKI
ncbi:hypothetical protein B296_00016762 [Ensete ventricosum]|uniref:Homeobox domain-containing protein n=1 Tax=Ensete ventricosum TaxID=4639 RepID=A0A426YF17_ENSVE|nr:hypothetical protein B296_00016762 [Ensete ventricosum]